jgi:glucose dehydrogenase
MTNGMLLALRIAIAALASASIVWVWHWYMRDFVGIAMGVLLAAPVVWRLLVGPIGDLRREGAGWLWRRRADGEPRADTFDDVAVRIRREDDVVRFHADDVAKATALRGIPTQGRGYVDLATLEKWLGKRSEAVAQRFLAWARKRR